jgi:hypothetical protein
MQEKDPQKQFAETLFDLYPAFIPTQALYLDLEGRKNGSEDIMSMYWPVLPGAVRFSWIKRSETSEIGVEETKEHLRSIKATDAKWIVVYSAGQALPDERSRVVDLLGQDPFPKSEWINLIHVVQQCKDMKRSITEHRNVWYGADRIQVRNSLEALEWEFGIERPINIRSHSNCYRDLDGGHGDMQVLATAQRSISESATGEEQQSLREYCEADVRSMFEIAYTSEKLLFTQSERQDRRRVR